MRGDITEQFVLFIINIGVDKMKPTYYGYNPKGAAKYRKDKGIDESGLGTDGLEGFKSAAKEIAKKGDNAEKKRQSAMVMEADLNDQSKGAEDYINKKYGKEDNQWYPSDFSDYKDFENAVLDVMSESEISSKYPNNVWERAAKRYTKLIYDTEQATSPFKKLSKATKSGVKKK